MKVRIVVVVAASALLNYSCVQVPITPDLNDLGGFPMRIGSHWTYATYDSLSHARDTVTVTVIGRTTTPSRDTTYQCLYQHRAYADTSYTIVIGDTVKFATDNAPPVNLVFPLTVGVTWTFGSYDAAIVAIGPDTLPAGICDTTIVVEEEAVLPNDFSRYDYWIVEGVGVVQFYDQTFITVNNERRKTLWRLLSYSL